MLGESPCYIAPARRAYASSVRELLGAAARGARQIDATGLRQYFQRRPDGTKTCFQGIQRLPAGFDLCECDGQLILRPRMVRADCSGGDLLALLENSVATLLASSKKVAVALSGGLDSALVLMLVRRLTGRAVPILTLATGLPGYCELDDTLTTARILECGSVEAVQVSVEQMVDALPAAITACETPLFNLHPVSKLLLARAAAAQGFDAVITGDGADQVFAGSDARNYIPIIGALVRATGVALWSPFFDERIIAWARARGTDPEKTALRTAAGTLLPAEIAWRKKSPRLAPDFVLDRYRDPHLEAQLAPRLGLQPPTSGGEGPEQTLWATAAILIQSLGGSC